MSSPGLVLAIETSCDESAAAVLDPAQGFLGEFVHSQINEHRVYGGVVPDLASREHLTNLPPVVAQALAKVGERPLDLLAVTEGPGLPGCLALGIAYAQAFARSRGLSLVGVNHLRAHAWSTFLPLFEESPPTFRDRLPDFLPHLGLLVSGGNTLLFCLDEDHRITVLAKTVDDAAGEALDKGAKLLGLPYPGGPEIERWAEGGTADRYPFPVAFAEADHLGFSFSGLKTSLRYRLEKIPETEFRQQFADLCASYQAAVIDALVLMTRRALQRGSFRSLGLSGGVANNGPLRERFAAMASPALPALTAARRHTGDNAGMIAFAAWLDQDQFSSEPRLSPGLTVDATGA